MRRQRVWTNCRKIFTQNNLTRASWPASSHLATFVEACCTNGFLDFLDLYLFCANISDLYPPNFILLICSMQLLVKYCQCYGTAYHCFFTFWTSGTHSSGGQWRWWTFPASSTWSPIRAENPSLWQSASSCSFMVVSGAIIIVVEPWKNMLCWSQVCDERKLPNGRSWLAISMGRVLPMPVGRQERMWCLSSSSTTAAVMSACNCHIFDAILSATKS